MIEQQLEEKYYELQWYDAEIKRIEGLIKEVELQLQDVQDVTGSIDQISALPEGTKILAPLANGIFVEAILGNPKRFWVNVGNQVVIIQPAAKTQQLMQAHSKELETHKHNLLGKLTYLLDQTKKLEQEIVALTSRYEQTYGLSKAPTTSYEPSTVKGKKGPS
ncbi:MAG: hypothetical protein QW594_04410 [Candidatus Woesearchaeota archaeon]